MPTHTLMPCSESTKQSGNCVIQVQEDQKRNLSPCAARDAIMIPRHIFLVTVVSSALQAPTQLSTCIHTHTHTHTHRGTHNSLSRDSSAISEEIASRPQLHKSFFFHTHLFSFFSCLQGRDRPLLHPKLGFNPISFPNRLLRWHSGKEPACQGTEHRR